MAEWIKVEKTTATKPEVMAIASLLSIHHVHAFGLCVRFWCWCDDHLSNGNARGVTENALDTIIGHEGFCAALIKVGWLQSRHGTIAIPNFDRHLSQSAKHRALTAARVAKSKAKKGNDSVTLGALPEKRREEKILNPPPPKPPPKTKPLPTNVEKPAAAEVMDWKNAADELARAGLERAVPLAKEARNAGLDPGQVLAIVAEFEANRRKFTGPGAIADRIRTGSWPVSGIVPAAVAERREAAQDAMAHESELRGRLAKIVKTGRASGTSDDVIRRTVRDELGEAFCVKEGW